jgi:hypothetical protein
MVDLMVGRCRKSVGRYFVIDSVRTLIGLWTRSVAILFWTVPVMAIMYGTGRPYQFFYAGIVRLHHESAVLNAEVGPVPFVEDVFVRNSPVYGQFFCFFFDIGQDAVWQLKTGLPILFGWQEELWLFVQTRREREVVGHDSAGNAVVGINECLPGRSIARIMEIDCQEGRPFIWDSWYTTIANKKWIFGVDKSPMRDFQLLLSGYVHEQRSDHINGRTGSNDAVESLCGFVVSPKTLFGCGFFGLSMFFLDKGLRRRQSFLWMILGFCFGLCGGLLIFPPLHISF